MTAINIPTERADSDDSGAWVGRIGWATILLLVVVIGGWMARAPLDAAIVASGTVAMSGDNQTVQHPDGGLVSTLSVREGDRVERGQVLLELDSPALVARQQALLSQMVELQMRRARLTAEQAGVHTLKPPAEWAALVPEDRAVADAAFERNQREAGPDAWSPYEARIKGYRNQIGSIDRQRTLVEDELAAMSTLAKDGLIPLTRVREFEILRAELSERGAELVALIATTQQERDEALRRVDAQLAELAPQLAGAREQLEIARLRAPVSGTVVGLTAHTVGGVVKPGERIMEIVPEGLQTLIEAQIRPEDADNVQAGQRAEIRITAFRGSSLPIVYGTVERVSADRFVNQNNGMAYFEMDVAVAADDLKKLSEHARSGGELRSGLPADVVVPIRKRTVLQYLLEPLHQAAWLSLREE